MATETDIEKEKRAVEAFEHYLLLALKSAAPIAHWGDGEGGHIIHRVYQVMRELGYRIPKGVLQK